jgi:CBS domain-containing protein
MMTETVMVMSKARAGSVLVLEDGALVGIFTERDVLRAFIRCTWSPPCRRA